MKTQFKTLKPSELLDTTGGYFVFPPGVVPKKLPVPPRPTGPIWIAPSLDEIIR